MSISLQARQRRMEREVQGGHIAGIDRQLLWVVVALLLWGVVMVYSSSIALPDSKRFAHFSHTHFVRQHLLSMALALVLAIVLYHVSMDTWQRYARGLFVISLLGLLWVLLFGIEANGAYRWVNLGFMSAQPSELSKLCMVLYAADYMVRKIEVRENFLAAVWPMVVAVALIGVLLLLEPDLGAFMVIAVIAVGVLFLGGVNARMFFLISVILMLVCVAIVWSSDWRRERILAFWNPWDPRYRMGKGYQITNAQIALGRGEWFGVGLGGSVEKLHWLSEANTDFMVAILGEEFGLVGLLVLITLLFVLVRKIFVIGRDAIAKDRIFSGLVAQGVAIWIGFQACVSIGVNVGALPTKGLSLPLMGYGGSAILVNMIALALVFRVARESYLLQTGHETAGATLSAYTAVHPAATAMGART